MTKLRERVLNIFFEKCLKSHVADTCTPPRRINKSLNEVSTLLEFPRRERDNEQRLPLVVFFFHFDLSFS